MHFKTVRAPLNPKRTISTQLGVGRYNIYILFSWEGNFNINLLDFFHVQRKRRINNKKKHYKNGNKKSVFLICLKLILH